MTSSPNIAQLLAQHAQLLAALKELRVQLAVFDDTTAVPGELMAREAELVAEVASIEAALRASGITNISTAGGDVAGRDIDKRQGTFIGQQIIMERCALPTPAGAPHQPWIMPHDQNPLFLGRAEELEHLEALLTSDEPMNVALLPALAGLGGIGKTQLAITFAHTFRSRFPGGVFWLSMENSDTIAPQVAACGGPAGLRLFDDESTEGYNGLFGLLGRDVGRSEQLTLQQRVARVRAAWEQSERRLLIFDNLEKPALLEEWRPHGGGSRVLVTTRSERWAAYTGVQTLPLRPLADPDSLTLLLRPRAIDRGRDVEVLLAEPGARVAAQALVRELGGLPLALTLAGHYLVEHSLSLPDYLEALRRESVQHTSLNTDLCQGLPTGHAASIVATFALSVARLHLDDPTDQLAHLIWLRAAHLAPEPISLELLLRLVELEPCDATQRERGDRALLRLREVGLLEIAREGQADYYQLHRLLAAYARSLSADETHNHSYAEVATIAVIQWLDTIGRLADDAVLLQKHILYLIGDGYECKDISSVRLYFASAQTYAAQENHHQAISLYKQVIIAVKELLGENDVYFAVCLYSYSISLFHIDQDYLAEEYITRSLNILENNSSVEHRTMVKCLFWTGRVYFVNNKNKQSMDYFRKIIAICHHHNDTQYLYYFNAVHEVGRILRFEGRFYQSKEYFCQSLTLKERFMGENHRENAKTLDQIGSIFQFEGKYEESLQRFEESYHIKRVSLGDVHESLVDSLRNISETKLYLHKDVQAVTNLRQALEISKKLMKSKKTILAKIEYILALSFLVGTVLQWLFAYILSIFIAFKVEIAIEWRILLASILMILLIICFRKKVSIQINKVIWSIMIYAFIGFVIFGRYFPVMFALVFLYRITKNKRIVIMIRSFMGSAFVMGIYAISSILRRFVYLSWRRPSEYDL